MGVRRINRSAERKAERRDQAIARQEAYEERSIEQKLARASGIRERVRLERALADEQKKSANASTTSSKRRKENG